MNDKICYYECATGNKLQETISQNVTYEKSKNFPKIVHWNKYTGEIPLIQNSIDSFKKFYSSKVIDQTVLEDLEDEKVINAVPNLAKLYPIITPANGNCLCHAVSLYMWGIADRGNNLRQLLYITLVTDEKKLLQRLYMQHTANEQSTEEIFNSGIWNRQWEKLVVEAQEIPMNSGSTHLEPLEAIHIFILANILLRPIIVLSSPVVRTAFNLTIQTNNIGGIYLPLLRNPDDTEKSPIVLGFHMNHFTPLLHMEDTPGIKAVPLKRIQLVTLPVHFSQDTLPDKVSKRLETYLNIDKNTESALIRAVSLPKEQNVFYAHFEHCKVLCDNATPPVAGRAAVNAIGRINENELNKDFLERHSETIHILSSSLNKNPSPCINNCGMYGSAEFGNKCSKCFATDSCLSNMTPQRSSKQRQELRPTYEDDLRPTTNEEILRYNFEQLSPARESKPLFQPSQEIPVQNHKRKQPPPFQFSYNDFQPAEFVNSREASDESTVFIPIPQKTEQQFEQNTLETATCLTSGCRAVAHRKLQYRCPTCFIKRNSQSTGGATFRPVQEEKDRKPVNNFSQLSNNLPILSGQGAVANPSNTNPFDRTQIATQLPVQNAEERQVSLLELLCSEYNCPNRRMSPLNSLCSSCSKRSSKLCSTPGCANERKQNIHNMCNECFINNELKRQKIPTQRNPTNYIFDHGSYNTNHEQHPQPSAPSFHK